jgi:chromosome partitioning protein
VPFQPRSLDVWAVADIAALIEEARALNPELQALAVLNLADPAGTDNADAAAAVADYPALQYLDTPIRRRKSVANAAGNGLSVLEQTPRDEKAIMELNALMQSIF